MHALSLTIRSRLGYCSMDLVTIAFEACGRWTQAMLNLCICARAEFLFSKQTDPRLRVGPVEKGTSASR